MRNLTAVHLAASVALALASTMAAAQLSGAGRASAGTGTTAAAGGSSTAGAANASGTSASANATGGQGVERVNSPRDTSQAASAPSSSGVSGNAGGSSTTDGGGGVANQGNFDARSFGAANSSSFGRGGPFSNDSGNSALGQSPGQTSSGTAAGNSGTGIDAGSATLGTDNALAGTAPGGIAFGTAGTGFAPAVAGSGGVDVNGQRSANPSQGAGAVQQSTTVISTPLLDQTVRQAQAREQRRRNAGQTPRIIGIAPNTDADLSHQMPDDRIIRY